MQEMQETWVQSLGWGDSLEGMASHSSILTGLAGYSPLGLKELDMTEHLNMHTCIPITSQGVIPDCSSLLLPISYRSRALSPDNCNLENYILNAFLISPFLFPYVISIPHPHSQMPSIPPSTQQPKSSF